jgi:hypothetical protein
MAKYVLNPKYGDMSIVELGASVKVIIKKLTLHWEDAIEHPEDYSQKFLDGVNFILNKRYKDIESIMIDYNELIDEDYSFEELY